MTLNFNLPYKFDAATYLPKVGRYSQTFGQLSYNSISIQNNKVGALSAKLNQMPLISPQ
jgi:hypothetical protein